ncbi:MAG: serine/threonine-protein kinase, partial [Dokdonella sp.]
MLPGVEIGDQFGAFELTEELARGGMGVVYLAKRHDGSVEQHVALKVLLHKHHDADSVRRLNRERQLLARLEHPHIARLIDAGENAQGVPYFAMEYVRGMSITRYCDHHGMAIAQRIALFRAVCSAVLHAHTHLVVHGDLKPGNILVTDEGLPKLLDFGIAVSLRGEHETDSSAAVNGSEPRFFSAHTAAPEQLSGAPSNIATDVYSLGVLLCEMLGGRRPHELKDLAPDQLLAVVCKQPPLLPSAAANSLSAKARGSLSGVALQRRLRGDLDAIVAKALSKRPQLRYLSVDQLIQDIDRNAAHRPIAARRHERGYSALKFIQRNILAIGFAAVTTLLLLGFLSYALVQNRRLSVERDTAHRQEQQAQFERNRAQQVTDFLINLFQSADPAKAQGK